MGISGLSPACYDSTPSQSFTVTVQTSNTFQYQNGFFGPVSIPGPTAVTSSYPTCAGAQSLENVYLAQEQYTNAPPMVTTLELYYGDLDNGSSTVVGAYDDWATRTPAGDQSGLFSNHDAYCPPGV